MAIYDEGDFFQELVGDLHVFIRENFFNLPNIYEVVCFAVVFVSSVFMYKCFSYMYYVKILFYLVGCIFILMIFFSNYRTFYFDVILSWFCYFLPVELNY